MKRIIIVLSIIVMLAIFSSFLPLVAQPTHIPHQNPAFAENSSSPLSLLTFYGDVYKLASSEYYFDAMGMLTEIKDANISKNLRDLIDLYNTQSQRLFLTTNDLELLLDEVSNLITDCPGCITEQRLEEIEATISEADIFLDDINTMTNTLGNDLGVFIAAAGSSIKDAYDYLITNINAFNEVLSDLKLHRNNLIEQHEIQVEHLKATEISLNVIPDTVFVGDNITVLGRLTSSGASMANKQLTLLLDDDPLDTITTDINGSYATKVTVPNKYVSHMTLKAIYTPLGDDVTIYRSCESIPVVINTSFYPTSLEVIDPGTCYPEISITISGQVKSGNGTIARTVRVLLDDRELGKQVTEGKFDIQIIPPQQTETVRHRLTVVVDPQGRYSDVSTNLMIDILAIPIEVDIDMPLLVFIPGLIDVSGKVYHDLNPIQNAQVTLTFNNFTTKVKTSREGSFNANIEVPRELSFIERQKLELAIETVEDKYLSLKEERWILTINPSNLGLTLIALVSMGLLVFHRVRSRSSSQKEELFTPEDELLEPLILATAEEPEHDYSDIQDKIYALYLKGSRVVEEVTDIYLTPNTTLREFLDTTTFQLPTAVIKPFTELTLIAEDVLYSAHKPDENTLVSAEQLASIIKEEIYGGAS
jgi:hypothetical protein